MAYMGTDDDENGIAEGTKLRDSTSMQNQENTTNRPLALISSARWGSTGRGIINPSVLAPSQETLIFVSCSIILARTLSFHLSSKINVFCVQFVCICLLPFAFTCICLSLVIFAGIFLAFLAPDSICLHFNVLLQLA